MLRVTDVILVQVRSGGALRLEVPFAIRNKLHDPVIPSHVDSTDRRSTLKTLAVVREDASADVKSTDITKATIKTRSAWRSAERALLSF